MDSFCTKCGNKLVPDSIFCQKCGNKVKKDINAKENNEEEKQPQIEVETKNSMGSKNDIIIELEKERKYFLSKEMLYNQRNGYINYLNTVKKPSVVAWFFGGGVLAVILYILLVLVISIDIGAGLLVLWIIISIWGYVHFNNKFKNTVQNTKNVLMNSEAELHNFYNAYLNSIIAFDYSEPAIIQRLITLLQNGRADTLKESINVMLDDIHKHNMLNQQTEIAKNASNAATATGLLVGISLLSKRR